MVDVELDRFAHLDKGRDFGRALGSFGDAQRAGLNEDFDVGESLEFFDDRQTLNEHPRVFGVASQLSEQAGGPTGRAITKPLSFQDDHTRAAAAKLHRRAQSGNAATDDDYVCSMSFHHDYNFTSRAQPTTGLEAQINWQIARDAMLK
jgi:hypothetical protein